jgi:hypothetical protein
MRVLRDRKAAAFAGLSLLILFGGSFASLLLPENDQVLGVMATVAGYIACGRYALKRWHADDRVFDHPTWTHIRIFVAAVAIGALASTAAAQQTLFNLPSADVLSKGRTYVEADALWRARGPDFAVFTGRGVYGFGANIEAGLNFGGFVSPGHSAPTATPNIKWQPWKDDTFAITTGFVGLFFLRGSADGKPAALGYAHVAAKLPTNTRLTIGGYWGSSGYAAPDPRAGALVGFEQVLVPHLNLLADWFSGESGIGYLTPGVSSTWGGWTLYAGYSIKNGDLNGNATLFELGFIF